MADFKAENQRFKLERQAAIDIKGRRRNIKILSGGQRTFEE